MDSNTTVYPLKLNKDYYVVTANDLIKGRQKMSLREAQILYMAMSQVVKEDKDFKTYSVPVTTLAEFMDADASGLYRSLEKICTDLLKRVVKIQMNDEQNPQEKKWKAFQWISCAEYDNGKLTIKLNDELKPFLIDLVSKYSQVLLGTLCSFKSYYAARLYQLIVCERNENPHKPKNEWEFSCDQIREYFQLESNEYPRTYDLINKMFKPALMELCESDYCIIWDIEDVRDAGRGRPLAGIRFHANVTADRQQKDFFLRHIPVMQNLFKANTTPVRKKSKKAAEIDENQLTLDIEQEMQTT